MFQQLLTPVADALLPSFIVATLPIVAVLVLLGVFRRPAWQASLAGLIVGLIIAVGVWQFPIGLAFNAVAAGATFALWPVMWIVFNALLLYNVAVRSGRFTSSRFVCRSTSWVSTAACARCGRYGQGCWWRAAASRQPSSCPPTSSTTP